MIYLDYMATTPVDQRVNKAMQLCLDYNGTFANPSSMHAYGKQAIDLIENARQQFADSIGMPAESIVWTSGATESNNIAILGAAEFYQRQGKHIITCGTEHKSVLETCCSLERKGFKVTVLKPQKNGLLDMDLLRDSMQSDTILVSIMHVNNETGVIQPIKQIADIVHEKGALFHVDGAQSLGKVPFTMPELGADIMSFSGHKIYAAKGVGALVIRQEPRIHLSPLCYGGSQEKSIRPGTLATHQIVGMGLAAHIAQSECQQNIARIKILRDQLWKYLEPLGGIVWHGDRKQRIVHNLNIGFEGVRGEALITSLDSIAISSGSACNAASFSPSYVLITMGYDFFEAERSLRISIGKMTTSEDIEQAGYYISKSVKQLRAVSPLWQQ